MPDSYDYIIVGSGIAGLYVTILVCPAYARYNNLGGSCRWLKCRPLRQA